MSNKSILINERLYNEIKDYCSLNNLKIQDLCSDLLKKGLNELKYGDIPFGVIKNNEIEETLPKEDLVDESKIPSKLVANEILPSVQFSEPKGVEILEKIEKETSQSEKKQEQKKITKRVRVLK